MIEYLDKLGTETVGRDLLVFDLESADVRIGEAVVEVPEDGLLAHRALQRLPNHTQFYFKMGQCIKGGQTAILVR